MDLVLNCRNIILIGFMGAGKSTVGARLADLLNYNLVDLDQMIMNLTGCPIKEIFSREGEGAFRKYETAALNSLAQLNGCVIATGGGIVGRNENWLAMRRLGPIVYLQVSWDLLRQRISGDEERPLADQSDGGGRLRQLWEARLPLYGQADLVVNCGGDTPDEIASRIIAGLKGILGRDAD